MDDLWYHCHITQVVVVTWVDIEPSYCNNYNDSCQVGVIIRATFNTDSKKIIPQILKDCLITLLG